MTPILIVVFLFTAALFVWMFFIEPRAYQVNRHTVVLPKKLPRPLRILQLSDIHFAKTDPPLEHFFDRLAQESFDFVFVTGDIVDCVEGIPVCVANFKKLRPAYGLFTVFGNHDYYDYHLLDAIFRTSFAAPKPRNRNQPDLFEEALKRAGMKVLKNETVELEVGGTPLLIHGIDDPVTGHANLRRTMQNFDPAKINFLLTHTVDVFVDIGDDEIDLSFSGHSHGGQVCFPFIGPVVIHTIFGKPYVGGRGLVPLKGAQCSISRGLGASRYLFFRLLCPPEAVVVEVEGRISGC